MIEKSYKSPRGIIHYWYSRLDRKAGTNAESSSSPKASFCLVFLHGLTANHHLFDRQVDFFASRYSILVWDAPGHGSSRPYEGFSYQEMAEDLDQILKKEGVKNPVLIGHSMGGFVAQSYLKRYPGKAVGFIGIGTCPYDSAYYTRSDLWWLRQIKWMAGLFPDRLLRRTMAKQCGFTASGRKNMLNMLQDHRKKELCGLMHLGFNRLIPELEKFDLGCPAELIVGSHDRTGKVQRYNRKWHEKEGYPLHMIKDAAHNANDDQPEQVNRIIEAFLFQWRMGVC